MSLVPAVEGVASAGTRGLPVRGPGAHGGHPGQGQQHSPQAGGVLGL